MLFWLYRTVLQNYTTGIITGSGPLSTGNSSASLSPVAQQHSHQRTHTNTLIYKYIFMINV